MQNDMTTKIADRIIAVCEKIGWPKWESDEGRLRLYLHTRKNTPRMNWEELGGDWHFWVSEEFEQNNWAQRHPLSDYVGLCVMERHFREWMEERGRPCVRSYDDGYIKTEPCRALAIFPSYIEAQLAAIEAMAEVAKVESDVEIGHKMAEVIIEEARAVLEKSVRQWAEDEANHDTETNTA